MRITICDDEPLALDRLSELLRRCPDVELAGALGNGEALIEAIGELKPDLVMLDIEMPLLDGFDVVEALFRMDWPDPESVPLICFVTAYPQFATEAFESGALDFLAKPVRLQRVAKTLDRARSALAQREAVRRLRELSSQLDALRRASLPDEYRSLWIHRNGEMVRLDISDLDWLEAEGEYVRLHSGERSYLYRTSLSALSERLEDDGFVRVHRSATVNGKKLKAIRHTGGGGMKVQLSSGIEVPVGRRFRGRVRDLVAGG